MATHLGFDVNINLIMRIGSKIAMKKIVSR